MPCGADSAYRLNSVNDYDGLLNENIDVHFPLSSGSNISEHNEFALSSFLAALVFLFICIRSNAHALFLCVSHFLELTNSWCEYDIVTGTFSDFNFLCCAKLLVYILLSLLSYTTI